jgi:hypothetical protein
MELIAGGLMFAFCAWGLFRLASTSWFIPLLVSVAVASTLFLVHYATHSG